ncbi:MAG: transcriptional repressor [Deferrisomatales bacterium]
MNAETGRAAQVDLDRLRRVFREHGLRLTHQRIELYGIVVTDPGHPTVEAVFRRAQETLPTVSLDTVYRTLSLFEEMGLIARVHPLDPTVRYDPNPAPHHHLVCRRCHTIVDFDWPQIDEMEPPVPDAAWGSVERRRVEIWGLCRRCAQAQQDHSPPGNRRARSTNRLA